MHRSHMRLIWSLIFAGALISGMTAQQRIRILELQEKGLRTSIQGVRSSEKAAVENFPIWKNKYQESMRLAEQHIAPLQDNSWYYERLSQAAVSSDLEMDYIIRGVKVPVGLNAPWKIYSQSDRLMPALVPFVVEVRSDHAMLNQIFTYLDSLEDVVPASVIGRLEIRGVPDDYSVMIWVYFPSVQHPQLFEQFEILQLPKTEKMVDDIWLHDTSEI